jgi:hypothetical protein
VEGQFPLQFNVIQPQQLNSKHRLFNGVWVFGGARFNSLRAYSLYRSGYYLLFLLKCSTASFICDSTSESIKSRAALFNRRWHSYKSHIPRISYVGIDHYRFWLQMRVKAKSHSLHRGYIIMLHHLHLCIFNSIKLNTLFLENIPNSQQGLKVDG